MKDTKTQTHANFPKMYLIFEQQSYDRKTNGMTAEEKENKEFALKLFDFVQKKLEQKDDNTHDKD